MRGLKTIIVVDDDEVFRLRLVKAFKDRNFLVEHADSFEQASLILNSKFFDYAVFDLSLPDGTGLDLVKLFNQKNPASKSIILTGYGTIASAVQAIKNGAVQYMSKPTNADAIIASFEGYEPQIDSSTPTLSQVEWEHMNRVINDHGGNITQAAKTLGLHRRSLQRKIAKNPGKLS
ncbi:MAG: response regulator [Bdellovibrionales bacterium]|nr:response regulator [Bdellovibrionales bacterium]